MTEFDWVSAQFECSVQKAFTELIVTVQADIATARRMHGERSDRSRNFEFAQSQDRFIVTRTVNSKDMVRVEFVMHPHAIVIDSRCGPSFVATVRLNNAGRCIFECDGAELEAWQMRRKALAELFFGPLQTHINP